MIQKQVTQQNKHTTHNQQTQGHTMYTQAQLTQLQDFFSYKRPHNSLSEHEWINKYIIGSLKDMGHSYFSDTAGNVHVDLRKINAHRAARTLFVAHTDTVHRTQGRQDTIITNNINKAQTTLILNTYDSTDSNCLGADDGAGVFVLLSLIKSGVAGYFIFTRGEECGGIGSTYLAKEYPHLLLQFDRAVAFDRKSTSSVITHQAWGRCCSDEFADALSDALTDDYLMYAPDNSGVYTDTAEFVDVIAECTNVSVGYMHEHSTDESLDLVHLFNLVQRVVQIDWEALPTKRDPSIPDPKDIPLTNGFAHAWNALDDLGFTEYNSQVYDALVNALSQDYDGLLWLIAEAVQPRAADEVYDLISSATPTEEVIRNAIRHVDRATSDIETEDALVDMFNELFDGHTQHSQHVQHYYQ